MSSISCHLFWVYFTHERDGFEILKAQVGELEKLCRHEGHDDVETEQADVSGSHILSGVRPGVWGRQVDKVLKFALKVLSYQKNIFEELKIFYCRKDLPV